MYGELDISLKNKVIRNIDDFKQFKTKLFFRTILMVIISIIFISCLYFYVLHGNFANWAVSFFQQAFRMEWDAAYSLYTQIFRNHMEVIIAVSIVLVFFIVFYTCFNWLTKYFREINNGIDTLLDESAEEISLSPELSAVEKKINTIKHTLEKQKLDVQLAEQRKNDLVVYLAHDLKTPLASIIGYLNLLHDEKDLSDELREKYVSITLDKTEHLEDLINEFFEIAKFNLSNITLEYSKINVGRLLEMLLYEFQPMLKEKNLLCNLNIPENTMLKCDANKMQRVFDNLLRNAVIYSFEGTKINILATKNNDTILFQFSNHGDTIPEDKLERIFEQFYRLDATRKSNGGAGLGLAIAKQIIELHHGTIMAKSEHEITTFEVILPLS